MKGIGPFSLLGSSDDSGACCQPEVHDRKPRLVKGSSNEHHIYLHYELRVIGLDVSRYNLLEFVDLLGR